MIKLVWYNFKIRWQEWRDKRPLIGESIFVEVESLLGLESHSPKM